MRYCINCGHPVKDEEKRCSTCGYEVNGDKVDKCAPVIQGNAKPTLFGVLSVVKALLTPLMLGLFYIGYNPMSFIYYGVAPALAVICIAAAIIFAVQDRKANGGRYSSPAVFGIVISVIDVLFLIGYIIITILLSFAVRFG